MEQCEECENPLPCPHCDGLMIWHDMFGIHWCEYMYWGRVKEKDDVSEWLGTLPASGEMYGSNGPDNLES